MTVETLKGGACYIDLAAADWADVVPGLAEAWPVVAGAVERFALANPAWEWDRLRAYVRFGSGLIWFSPDPEEPRRNANVAGVKVACLEAMYYELPDVEVDADAFERGHDEMDRRLFEALRQAALLPGPRAALAAVQRVRPHRLTFVQYDDLETERELVEPGELID